MQVFEIREERFESLVEAFTKMVRRAKKNHLPAPHFEIIHEADENKVRQTGRTDGQGEWITQDHWVRYLYVTVEGERPTLAGWDFIATVDHTDQDTDGSGNVIKSVPGAGEIPVSFRNALPVCEHCNTGRRRNETFVVRRHDDPSITRQIGRNCLQDFFPGLSPADVAQQLAWWVEATEMLIAGEGDEAGMGSGGGGRAGNRYGLESLLHNTQGTIEAFGWVSRTKAKETSGTMATADRVLLLYEMPSQLSRAEKEEVEKIQEHIDIEKNATVVAAALEWVRGIDPETAEDYLYNLHTVTKGETVRDDRLGLACSLLPAYRRHIEGERRKQEHEAHPSEYVGTVGERGLFVGCKLEYVSEPFENAYGTTTRLTFKQGDNVLIWWASNPDTLNPGNTYGPGDVYDICATVKAHEKYMNRKSGLITRQTTITRVKVATDKDRKKFQKMQKTGTVS